MTEPKAPEPSDLPAELELSRRTRFLFGSILVSASILVAVGLAELVARVINPTGPAASAAEPLGLYQHDSLLGWAKRPGTSVEVRSPEYLTREETNHLGLRGPATTTAKPEGTRRVLLLGDSHLEGYSVNLEDLVSTRLAAFLAEAGYQPVEVLNAGTAGYSTDQELLYFEREGHTLQPDVTVMFFHVNDVYFNAHGRYWRGDKPYFELTDAGPVLRGVPVAPPDPDRFAFEIEGGRGIARLVRRGDAWLGSHSALYRMVREGITRSPVLSGLMIRLGAAAVPPELTAWRRHPDLETAQAWKVTEALIRRLHADVEVAGGRFLIFYVPSRAAVYDDDWRLTRTGYAMNDVEWGPAADAETLSAICERAAIKCIFPLEQFRSAASRLAASGDRLYFRRDAHWTAEGHRLAARIIADALAESHGPSGIR